MIRRLRLLFAALLALIPALAVTAHPHMWIRGQIVPELGRKGLEAVRVIWDIDELTSAGLILDFDANGDGVLDSEESGNLYRSAFSHLYDSEYYIIVEIRDMLATPDRVREFNARIEGGRLIYDFRVPLVVPVRWEDLADVSLFFFDPTYFIDFRPEDLVEVTATWRSSSVEFRKVSRRSMTMGYGTVEVTGLQSAKVDEG